MSVKVEVHTNSHNLVEFWGPLHKTVAELNRFSGEWGIWKDGELVGHRSNRDEAVNEAARIAGDDR